MGVAGMGRCPDAPIEHLCQHRGVADLPCSCAIDERNTTALRSPRKIFEHLCRSGFAQFSHVASSKLWPFFRVMPVPLSQLA